MTPIHESTAPDGNQPAIARLFARGTPVETAISGFLDDHSFPLVAPGQVVFAWRGTAEQVYILRWIHGGVDRTAFERVPDTNLWLLPMTVEDGGRFEYKLSIRQDEIEHWIIDPLNPHTAGDPFGENSVCRTHGYERPEWSSPQGAASGRIETINIESPSFREVRQEGVYLPAGYDSAQTYPLLVVHDGNDFVTYADLAVSLDNLIANGDIPPVVAALVQTADRMKEYVRGRRHARYLVQDLLPAMEASYSLSDEPSQRVLLGASLGAVASLSTLFRYPGVFGGVILKSGSFIFDERELEDRAHPVFHRIARLVKAFQRAPDLPPTRAFVSTGELESLAMQNLTLAKFLEDSGVEVLFKSAWDGHHWHNWRDQLRDGLMWVLHQPSTNRSINNTIPQD